MLLRQQMEGHLLEVTSLSELFNPMYHQIKGRLRYGDEILDKDIFEKATLAFPSGESLPRCWLDPLYFMPSTEAVTVTKSYESKS
jgi:hypothetical protein